MITHFRNDDYDRTMPEIYPHLVKVHQFVSVQRSIVKTAMLLVSSYTAQHVLTLEMADCKLDKAKARMSQAHYAIIDLHYDDPTYGRILREVNAAQRAHMKAQREFADAWHSLQVACNKVRASLIDAHPGLSIQIVPVLTSWRVLSIELTLNS